MNAHAMPRHRRQSDAEPPQLSIFTNDFIARPSSAPPYQVHWFSKSSPRGGAEELSECSASSHDSSPQSTRPPSPYTPYEDNPSHSALRPDDKEHVMALPGYPRLGDLPDLLQYSVYREAELAQLQPRRTIYVVLERASMEICRAAPRSKPSLLNCDEHQALLARAGREVSDARPDITHQCLLTLLDSPLNKAGLLRIFIRTLQGLLIEVHPDVRIPRTLKRYSGLMVQLLQQGKICGASDSKVLLQILEHPLSHYLPKHSTKIALSSDARPTTASALARSVPGTTHPVLFVGAMAKGPDDFAEGIVERKVSLSSYPLSASIVCGKMCCAFEDLYGVL